MKTEELNIFLDESGKKSNHISLIGAISIPTDYYNSPEIQELNQKLRRKDINMHFTKYNKRDYSLYENIFQKILQIPDQIQFNLFLYQSSMYRRHPLLGKHTDDMLYQKLPERVIYGLFRANSNLELIQAKVFLENSSDYDKRNLAVNLKEQLNSHFLYRNDNYKIVTADLVPKNQQIGVEFTDCLLGISSLIIQNESLVENNDELHSKTLLAKTLLVDDFLPQFQQLFKQANIYELCGKEHLVKRSFDTYLRPFEARVFDFKKRFPQYTQDKYKRTGNTDI